MAIMFPLGFKFPHLGNKILTLWVNPETLRITRKAGLGQQRIFSGTVIRPWPNEPDRLDFSGTLYGLRGLDDLFTLKKIIEFEPDKKKIELIYKYISYPGIIENFYLEASVEHPYLFKYSFTFISLKAMELYTVMLNNLPSLAADIDYLNRQVYHVETRIRGLLDLTGMSATNAVILGFYIANSFTQDISQSIKETFKSSSNLLKLGATGGALALSYLKKQWTKGRDLKPILDWTIGATLIYSIKQNIAIERGIQK